MRLLITCVLLLQLIVGLRAGVFLVRNGVIYCKWSTRHTCDKTTPYCVKVTTPTTSCKNYRNECQFHIDMCLGKTVYGRSGSPSATPDTDCKSLAVGFSGTCG